MRPDQARYYRIAAYVRLHARRRPLKTAVLRNGETITYQRLDEDLRRMTAAIAAYDIPAGGIAAISHDDLYVQLLAVFACETLRITSGSYRPIETFECAGLIAAADLVLAQNPVVHPTSGRFVLLTDAWFQTLRAGPVPAATDISYAAPEEMLVIFHSSGTTGTPKLMPVSFRVQRNRDISRRRKDSVSSRTRYLATMHISVGTVYSVLHRCIRLGGTFLFNTARPVAETVVTLRPTHLTILPYHLRQMLLRLPDADTPLLPGLTIQCIGARTPDELRFLAAKKLGGRFLEGYGANEIGAIGEVDGDGIVALRAGVEAQIVEGDRILPHGEIGTIRVRSNTLIAGYLNNQQATEKMFRGGWFYPGDLGAMTEGGRLRLIGRGVDVLNLGGIKMSAAELEGKLLDFPGLQDVALIQPAKLADGMQVTVAAVVPPRFNMAGFSARLRAILNYPFIIMPVAAIPRTTEGKIQRGALQQALLAPPSAVHDATRPLETTAGR